MSLQTKNMPVVPLRGVVLFPGMAFHFDVSNKAWLSAMKAASNGDGLVFVPALPEDDSPEDAENTPGGIRVMLNSRPVKPNTQFVVEDDHAIIAMVEGGLGVSVLSDLVLKRSSFRVVRRPLDPPVRREIALAYPEGRTLSVSTRRFIDYVKSWREEG